MRYKHIWGFFLLLCINSSIFAHIAVAEFATSVYFRYFLQFGIQYLFSYGFYHILFIFMVVCRAQLRKLVLKHIISFFLTYILFFFIGISTSVLLSLQYSVLIILLFLLFLGSFNNIVQKFSRYWYLFMILCGGIQGLGTADIFKNYYVPALFYNLDFTTNLLVSMIAFIIGIGLVLFGLIILVYLVSILAVRYKWNKKVILYYTNIGILLISIVLLVKELF